MAFKNVSWKTGDLIDVTRLNQYMENNTYLYDMVSSAVLVNDSRDKWVDVYSANFRLKIDGNYSGTPLIADQTDNVATEYSSMNINITSLSAGTHTVIEGQGTDESVSHTFYKHPVMCYLSYWVTLMNDVNDGTKTFGRRNFTMLGSRDQL